MINKTKGNNLAVREGVREYSVILLCLFNVLCIVWVFVFGSCVFFVVLLVETVDSFCLLCYCYVIRVCCYWYVLFICLCVSTCANVACFYFFYVSFLCRLFFFTFDFYVWFSSRVLCASVVFIVSVLFSLFLCFMFLLFYVVFLCYGVYHLWLIVFLLVFCDLFSYFLLFIVLCLFYIDLFIFCVS